MNIIRKIRFTSTLPATPCSTEMRQKMLLIAVKQGASLAEVQRTAFEFFLANSDKLSIGSVTPVINNETS